jgi:uncharacterized protein (DUF433 family)
MEATLKQEGTPVAESANARQDAVEVPLYTPLDVARYFRAPVWVVAGMWRGRFPHFPEMFVHWFETWPRSFDLDDEIPEIPELRERWSFRQAADLYVLLFAMESLMEMARSEPRKGGRRDAIREATQRFLRCHFQVPVFFGTAPRDEGVARVLESCCDPLTEEERRWLEKRLLLCLARFDMEDGVPSRLYPFSRVPAEESPRIVVMDPRIRFGRPTITRHGTPTDILLERHQAGDSIADLAADYDLPVAEVEEAIRYEAKPVSLLFPFVGW